MKWLTCLLTVFGLWLLLFWSVSPAVLATGALFAVLVATVMGSIYPEKVQKIFNPRRWLFFLIYVPYFLYYCIKANIDVMLRVIHPDIPIKPGIVKVRTSLTTDTAKAMLANSITLTPGTLTVDIDGQDFYVHWINIYTDDAAQRTADICGRFEPLLRRIFE